MKKIYILIISILSISNLHAQTGIGTTTPNASAKLDVYSTNKGFLPPRVSLTDIYDQTTIASPAIGLLVYCKGDAGLAAGYYYWNGNAWATIATPGGSGSFASSYLRGSRTASQTVNVNDNIIFNNVDNSAGTNISLNTSNGKITLAAGNTYRLISTVPNFSGSRPSFTWYNETAGANIGSAVNGYSPSESASNGSMGGIAEVIITPNVNTVVYLKLVSVGNSTSTGSISIFPNGDFLSGNGYPWFEAQVISGNAPVTGQSVDYAIASLSANQSITTVSNVPFNTIQGAGITLTNGGFNLLANKTYKLEAEIGGSSTGYGYYGWADGSNNLLSGGSVGTVMQAGVSHSDAPQGKAVVYYTPTTNTTVYLRIFIISGTVTAYGPSSAIANSYSSTWATISQIGSSAIVNPWVLSGTTTTNITGNVGIGTLTPTATLDVTGNTNVSGILTAGGNAFPNSFGVSGQALTTNGSGTASWNPVPPVGVISAFAGSTAPIGYLLCDGSAVSRTTYSALYAIIGTTYGTGNGSTTFNLPDLRSKMIVGVGQGSGLTNRTLASTGGIESKTLSISEMPSHNHTITDPGHTHSQTTVNDDFNNSGGNPPGFTADGAGSRTWTNISSNTTGITINSTGGGTAFSVMNPFLALNYIIKY
jgi:microcystin-dependent protein